MPGEAHSPIDPAVATQLRARYSADPRLAGGLRLSRLSQEPDGALVIEGEVDRVAQKKIALEIAAAHPGVRGIVDRLHVRPAEAMGDGAVRSHLRRLITEDPALSGLSLTEVRAGRSEPVSQLDAPLGTVEVEVRDGVVTLNGEVSDLVIKRYIGVLAWWVPGTRDVINGLVAASDEADGPDRIADAVRAVLDRDPFVDAGQVRVGVRGRVVRLTGLVRNKAERRMAENDAWYVFGVDDVVNEIALAQGK